MTCQRPFSDACQRGPFRPPLSSVGPLVPARLLAGEQARAEALRRLQAQAEFAVFGPVGAPDLAGAAEQAEFVGPPGEPARPGMAGDRHAVEACVGIFLAPGVGAHAQAQALADRMLVFAAAPHQHADAGGRLRFLVDPEGQDGAIRREPDNIRIRGRAHIGVRRQGKTEIGAPALARPDGAEKALDVLHHRRRRLAAQHPLEMTAGERVLALEEEGPGKVEPGAHQAGPDYQHAPQGGNGGVEKGRAGLGADAFPAGRGDAGPADQEQQAQIVRPRLDGRREGLQRQHRAPGPEQCGCPGRRRLLLGRRLGLGHDRRGGRERAGERQQHRRGGNGSGDGEAPECRNKRRHAPIPPLPDAVRSSARHFRLLHPLPSFRPERRSREAEKSGWRRAPAAGAALGRRQSAEQISPLRRPPGGFGRNDGWGRRP